MRTEQNNVTTSLLQYQLYPRSLSARFQVHELWISTFHTKIWRMVCSNPDHHDNECPMDYLGLESQEEGEEKVGLGGLGAEGGVCGIGGCVHHERVICKLKHLA